MEKRESEEKGVGEGRGGEGCSENSRRGEKRRKVRRRVWRRR